VGLSAVHRRRRRRRRRGRRRRRRRRSRCHFDSIPVKYFPRLFCDDDLPNAVQPGVNAMIFWLHDDISNKDISNEHLPNEDISKIDISCEDISNEDIPKIYWLG
jgi:hypothetical protein